MHTFLPRALLVALALLTVRSISASGHFASGARALELRPAGTEYPGAQSATSAENLEHLRSAARFVVEGDLPHAEEQLQMVLRDRPEDYRALNLLGIIRAQQRRRQEAETIFLNVVRLKPDYPGVHVSLGLLYAETGRTEEAVAQLEAALLIEPGREDASKSLLELLRVQAREALGRNELEKSLSLLLRARNMRPADPDINYEFGMVALRMSLFEDARAAFEETLRLRPEDPLATYALARAQMGLAKIPVARDLFEKYLALRPLDPTGHFGLGVVLHMLEKNDEARKQFERSIELQPAQTETYVQLGFLDLEGNDLVQAQEHFAAALEHGPANAGALAGMGRIKYLRKEYPAAVDLLREALRADPSVREGHYYLGLAYARLGRDRESAEELEMAGRLEREDLDRRRIILKLLDPAEARRLESEQPKP